MGESEAGLRGDMYLALKYFHIACVVLSGAGFALRGWWSITGSPRLRARLTRILPHIVDSCLLASAIGNLVSASVDSQRGSCAPFGDPRALLF